MSTAAAAEPRVFFGLLTQQCHKTLIEDRHIFDAFCLRMLLSKVLGLGIVVGSAIVKVPQILNIHRSGSAEGVSLGMYLLELLGYTINFAYCFAHAFPFSTWGEYTFMTLQDIVILGQVLWFTGRLGGRACAGFAAYLVFAYVLVTGAVGIEAINWLYSVNLPIFLLSRAPQIIANQRAGTTGQLSVVTAFLNFAGSLARVFTTLQEVDDTLMLIGFVLGVSLNAVILAQIIVFWKRTEAALEKKAK
jgi:mannose-P-dolichol utilization defect protein 1